MSREIKFLMVRDRFHCEQLTAKLERSDQFGPEGAQ